MIEMVLKKKILIILLALIGLALIGVILYASGSLNNLLGSGKKCVITGCSNEICADSSAQLVSSCIWSNKNACYKGAECKVQSNGECGWTKTAQLTQCLMR